MVKLKKLTVPWNIGNKWLSFEFDVDIIKVNILSKIHDDHLKMWFLEC